MIEGSTKLDGDFVVVKIGKSTNWCMIVQIQNCEEYDWLREMSSFSFQQLQIAIPISSCVDFASCKALKTW